MNQAQVSALVEEFAAAWNSHDMGRFAACFTPDAEFVNVAGIWWRGRQEIEAKHEAAHAGPFKDSTLEPELAAFKEIGPATAVAHVTWSLTTGGANGTGATRQGVMSWTLREQEGKPAIISAHNTNTVAPTHA